MTEENVEEVEEVQELSAEELFEQHKAEISERFEEKSFFKRIGDMLSGLSQPKSSREYKLARVELQRLSAPILAILLPTLGIIALIVITAVTGQSKEVIKVEVARAVEEEAPLEEDEPEPEPEDIPPPDETVEVMVDTPTVGPVSDMVAPTATPTTEPVSVKPAAQDSVALIKSPVTMRSMTGSRTPGSIGRMTRGGAGYGDAQTEAAVMKALRWLKHTQLPNGSWVGMNTSNAGLAILAYLAHGETPATSKEFGETVSKAIEYLINAQYERPDGNWSFQGVDANEYATLIATYSLCEAYGMTKNPNIRTAAMRALQRIVDSQSPTGGWDYHMNKNSTRDDMSYAGWALQALKAGKMADMHPEGLDECIKKAIRCLKTRNFNSGGFNYTAGGAPTGLTATGCLCMQLLGYQNEPEVKASLDMMRSWKPSYDNQRQQKALPGGDTPGPSPQYYCYYAAQCKYQAGMCEGAAPENVKSWQEWNLAMKALYPRSMIVLPQKIKNPDGKDCDMGYWKAVDAARQGGDTMATCLGALQLMVYYRYLPTTQTDKSSKRAAEDKAKKSKKQDVSVEVDI